MLNLLIFIKFCELHLIILFMIDLGATTNNSNGLLGSNQHAKKVVSNSPGLVDFVIRLVIFVLNLPNGQVLFFGEIQIAKGL